MSPRLAAALLASSAMIALVARSGASDSGSERRGWHPLPGAPEGCAVNVAGAAADVEPVVWVPCADGAPACKEMQTGWRTDARPSRFGGWNGASHDRDGEARWLRFERQRSATVYEDVVIDVADSAPVTAVRYDMRSGCAVLAALGENRIQAIGQWHQKNARVEGTPATWMGPEGAALRPLPPPFASILVSAVAASDSTVALELGMLRRVVRAPAGSDSYSDGAKRTPGQAPVQVSTPVVVGDDVLVWSEHGAKGWAEEYRLDPDGTLVPFRARAERHVAAMATDGITMFWTESFGGEDSSWWQPSLEVWAAPYTSDPARLAATAHELTALGGATKTYVPLAAIAFGGLYAFQTDDGAMVIVRGADGAVKTVLPGKARRFHAPLVVTSKELWALAMSAQGGPNTALERIEIGAW